MKKLFKVAVIGGGMAGLCAAIACGRRFGGDSVIVLEKQSRVGRKLLATGNGRCNISNTYMSEIHYYGDRAIINSVIGGFSVQNIKRFLGGLGIMLREDSDGRIYPYSNQASTVLDCIRSELMRLGVTEHCDSVLQQIFHQNGKFTVTMNDNTISAENIIFACGSKASPSLGADDSGMIFLKKFGFHPVPFFPSLSPVETAEKYKNLKGVRAKGSVDVLADGKIIRKQSGEIQFTEKGISGICVFECARVVNEFLLYRTVYGKPVRKMQLSLDLMHDYHESDIVKYLRKCKGSFSEQPSAMILSGALHKRLSETVVHNSGIGNKKCSELTENELQRIADSTKHFLFTPTSYDAFVSAQVCAGGIGSRDIDPDTLAARKISGLYVCGEMLDVDGDCGGYNLHFAVGSALKAAKNIS